MESNELRIGNYVNYLGHETQITGTSIGYVSTLSSGSVNQSQVEPIPLTKERLLEIGFEKYDWIDGYFIKCNDRHLMIQFHEPLNQILVFFTKVSKDSGGHKMNGRDYFMHKVKLKYIHQIQNLVFVLAGKELANKKHRLNQ